MMRPRFKCRRGFTLIEAAMTTIIVGLGATATMALFGACSVQNRSAEQITNAALLANNIQECIAGLPFNDPVTDRASFGAETGETLATYDDVDDFDGRSFNPPIDANRQTISDLPKFTQVVSVWPVSSAQLSANSNEAQPTIAKGTYTGAVRIRVRILYASNPKVAAQEIYRSSWIRMDN